MSFKFGNFKKKSHNIHKKMRDLKLSKKCFGDKEFEKQAKISIHMDL